MSIERYEPAGMLDRRTDSWTAVVEQVAVLATRIADTELVPAELRGHPAAVAAVILYGREIGLPPMTALRSSHVINGRVGLAAEIMRGLVLAAGHEFIFREASGARCVAAGRRKGTETWNEVEWNLDMARAAKLLPANEKSGWAKYPRQMLKARATAELCRDLFADVIGGFEAIEEMEDFSPNGAVPAPPETTSRRTVRRQQTPAGVATLPPVPPVAGTPAAAPAGPPLPGEDGYDLAENDAKTIPADVTPPPAPDPEQDRSRDTSNWAMSEPQRKAMGAAFNELNLTDHQLALAVTARVIGREITTRNDLTRGEYRALMDTLTRIRSSVDMYAEIQRIAAAPDPVAELDGLFGDVPDDEEQERPRRGIEDVDTNELT